MEPLFRVQNLCKAFYPNRLFAREPFHALRDVSFDVEEGDILGIVGESGSGKTTLARSMLLLDPPTSGVVYFKGMCLSRLKASGMRRMRTGLQIIFQDPNGALNPRLCIRASMEEGLSNFGVPRRERLRRISTILDQVGIPPDAMDRYPHEFSGGQKQRIAIARALSLKPRFLVLDEPVSNLDVSIQAGIINLLLDLKSEYNLTYVFISHDLDLIAYLCTKIGVLRQGRLVDFGPTEGIMTRPNDPYTMKLFRNPEELFPDHSANKKEES